jgi:hypothetical protein
MIALQIRVVVATLILVTAAACATRPNPQEDLRGTFQAYHGHLRWGRWVSAASFLHPDRQQEFIGRHEALGDSYRVLELEIRSVVFKGEDEAEVQVRMHWLRDPDMTVQKDIIRETWVRGEAGWFLSSLRIESH